MEEFRTNIFEKTNAKRNKRILYNLSIFGAIIGVWILYFIGFVVGLVVAIGFTIVTLGVKLYDDKYMGISAYGERRADLVITEEYLEIAGEKIPYSEMKNLVIYIEDYLGKPKDVFGIHHGGNNLIEYEHHGNKVSFNYIIKRRDDYHRLGFLVDNIEKNPKFKSNLRALWFDSLQNPLTLCESIGNRSYTRYPRV
ncbi:MAG: hypothetical protein HOP30_09095 [Cyclobacteriaceae bacterium]|nr:hypothetical protein [Cyclobacteriaceae bacterium]